MRALGERTTSCRGTARLPVWMKSDCSGESDHLSLKRTVRYPRQKSQNEAYQVVLSPRASSGRDGIYQPFITSCRKPPLTRSSRRMRLRSDERTATTPRFCSASRASRESASFCCGVAIRSWALGRAVRIYISLLCRTFTSLFCCTKTSFVCRTITSLFSLTIRASPTKKSADRDEGELNTECCAGVLEPRMDGPARRCTACDSRVALVIQNRRDA